MARSSDKLASFGRQITAMKAQVVGAALQQMEVAVARTALADALADQQQRSGITPSYTVTVDGRIGAPLESVKPGGKIVIDFDYQREIAQVALDRLIALSPYRTKRPGADPATHYRDQHAIFINGAPASDLAGLKPGDAVAFVNLQPYSRKIELVSATTGRRLSAEAPDGVYAVVAQELRQRYGNVAAIATDFTGVVAGALLGQGTGHSRRLTKAKNRAENRYPTLTIKGL